VERDLALVLPAGVSAADVEAVILRRGGGYLESVAVFDEYRGSDITGRSVAWRLVFRAREKTLRDKEVDAAVEKILEALRGQLRVDRR
jgi:phenylalanyl-tRNA synthetase beta chain